MKTIINCFILILFAGALAACSDSDKSNAAACAAPSQQAVAAANQVPSPAGSATPNNSPCNAENLSMALNHLQTAQIPAVTAGQVQGATGVALTPAQLAALNSQVKTANGTPAIIAASIKDQNNQQKSYTPNSISDIAPDDSRAPASVQAAVPAVVDAGGGDSGTATR